MNNQSPNRWWQQDWLFGVLLMAATFLVYQPAWNGEAVYDDTDHLTPPELQSLKGLALIWTKLGAVSQYYPVVHSAFWIQHRLWGNSMLGYHLVNILIHVGCALLLLKLLQALEIPGARLAAAIFVLHPVVVESVAWISEQKNTVSGVFYLGAALAYLNFDRTRERRIYSGALILFILGLLSKSVIASLPAALLVVFWWKRGRVSWKMDVRPLLPFFVTALLAGVLTAWVEKTFIGAQGHDFEISLGQRCLIAGRAIWFYLGKIIWPANLVFIYPRWQVDAVAWWQYLFPAAALLLVASLWMLRRRSRGPLAALLFFAGTLFPALGFINVYPFRYSFVADHYQYLASLGPIVLAASGLAMLFSRRARAEAGACSGHWIVPTATSGALLLALAILSWKQAGMYASADTLWRATIARNPNCFVAYSNLGNDLLQKGKVEEAARMCEKAIELQPGFAEPHNNLGNALRRQGRIDEALLHYRRAIELRPDLAPAHCNSGYILLQKGELDEAGMCFQKAVELRPEFVKARVDLANVLLLKGRVDESIVQLRAALEIEPNDAEANADLGCALLQKGRFQQAITVLLVAVRVEPGNAKSHNDLGNALLQTGRVGEAMGHYRTALALQPDFDLAHFNLGCALRQLGELDQAIVQFEQAVEVQPGLAAAHFQLGNAWLERHRLDEAISQFESALKIEPGFADCHVNLAAALLQAGRAQEALAHGRAALKLQPENPETLAGLAWVLATWPDATVRNGDEAVELATRAGQLSPRNPLVLQALAAAYAEAGRFADAAQAALRAIPLAEDLSNPALAEALRGQLKIYQSAVKTNL